MKLDEKAQTVPPQQCRLCMHYTKYLTLGIERHLCELGKPMHDKCAWFSLRHIGATKI